MREGWRETRLGKVLEVIDRRCGTNGPTQVLSITEKRGIVPQEAVFRKRIATSDLSHYKVLEPLDIAYNPYLLWAGAIGQWLGQAAGVTSPVYECFRVRSSAQPRFLGLLLESGILTPYFDSTAIGSIQRRRRTTTYVFLDAPLLLPPLDEQRRIVDLITTVDEAVRATAGAQLACRLSLSTMVTDWCASWTGPAVAVGTVAKMGSGPSWVAEDSSSIPIPGGIRVLGIPNTGAGRDLNFAETTYVRGLPSTTRLLEPGSLLMIRTNGTRSRIGNIYRASEEAYGAAFSAFQIGIFANDPQASDFIYWMLSESRVQESISQAASGTTGLGNVAVGWLRNLEIPWPERNERERLASLFDAEEVCERNYQVVLAQLRELRSAILSDLLTGHHEIPASYDEVMG